MFPTPTVLVLPALPSVPAVLYPINTQKQTMETQIASPGLLSTPTCSTLPENNSEVISLKLSQFQRGFLIAEITQLEVHQALIQVGESLCTYSLKKTGAEKGS